MMLNQSAADTLAESIARKCLTLMQDQHELLGNLFRLELNVLTQRQQKQKKDPLVLTVGGDRLRDLDLDVDSILERLSQELAEADYSSPQPRAISLVLGNRSWSKQAMTRFVPFIESIASRVESLEADDIIAQREMTVGYEVMHMLAGALRNAPSLRSVKINDNALGPPSLESLRVMLTSKLTSIKFNNCGIDMDCVHILRESLLGIQEWRDHRGEQGRVDNNHDTRYPMCDLEEMDFSHNTIGIEGAEQVGLLLPHCPNLKVFIYAGARAEMEGSNYIANGLLRLLEQQQQLAFASTSTNPFSKLQVLNLSDCSFGEVLDEPVGVLCEALRQMPNLHTILLNDCGLETSGLKLVLEALVASKALLKHLELDDVGKLCLGSMGFASFLGNFTTTLQVFSIEGNEIGWQGIKHLIPFFKACLSLKTLNLSRNELGRPAARQLLSLPTKQMTRMATTMTTTAMAAINWKTLILTENCFDDCKLQEQLKEHFSGTDVVFGDDQDGNNDEDE